MILPYKTVNSSKSIAITTPSTVEIATYNILEIMIYELGIRNSPIIYSYSYTIGT